MTKSDDSPLGDEPTTTRPADAFRAKGKGKALPPQDLMAEAASMFGELSGLASMMNGEDESPWDEEASEPMASKFVILSSGPEGTETVSVETVPDCIRAWQFMSERGIPRLQVHAGDPEGYYSSTPMWILCNV